METNPSSPSQRPALGTPSNPAITNKTVEDPIISLRNEQIAVTNSAKIKDSMQEKPRRQRKTQDSEQQIQLKRQHRALKKSQTQQEYLQKQSLSIEEKGYEEFKKKEFDIAKFHGTVSLNKEQLRSHYNKALQRQKLHEKLDEEEKHEIRLELEKLLFTNPKLKTDLTLEEQRFYKAFNPHLSEEQIDSKSSETSLLDDEISPLYKLNFRPPREEPHSPTDCLPIQMDTIYDSDAYNSDNGLWDNNFEEFYRTDLRAQFYEEQPIFHAAKIKDSMNENPNRPKKQRNIIKATEPDAIFDFTKFFYLTTEKETAFIVNRTCKASFNSIPSIRYPNYKVHPSLMDNKIELSHTVNTSVFAKSTVYVPSQTTASEHQEENGFETTQRMIRELFNQLNH